MLVYYVILCYNILYMKTATFKPPSPNEPPPQHILKIKPPSPNESPPSPKHTSKKFSPPSPKRPPPKSVRTPIEVINSTIDAFYVAQPYITNRRTYYDKVIIDEMYNIQEDDIPLTTFSTRWKMTEEALTNTLDYIFEKLSHTCYMLCVSQTEKRIYKLSANQVSPSFQKAIQNNLSKLDQNNLITDDQKKYIKEFAAGPVRIMQCIMKHYDREKVQTENEYFTLLHDMIIPDGVYILNLTDAVILHKHNMEPFPSVTGNKPLQSKYDKSHYIPILSLSGQKGYSDIPIPNYDDVHIALGIKDLHEEEYITNWEDKKIHKAVFRGGPSGCGYTLTTNQRLKLLSINSPLIDAKIVAKTPTIDSKSIKFDPKYGLGMMNTGLKPGSFMSMKQQSNYKYIIHVDGNVNAYRLLTTMLTGSLILKVESEYESWVEYLIKPHQHYIRVLPDLSDLVSQIEWCERNPHIAKKIAQEGYEFAKKALTLEYIQGTIQKICWGIPSTTSLFVLKYDPHRNRYKRPVTPELPDSPLVSPKTPSGSPREEKEFSSHTPEDMAPTPPLPKSQKQKTSSRRISPKTPPSPQYPSPQYPPSFNSGESRRAKGNTKTRTRKIKIKRQPSSSSKKYKK
jgi:hypothetical protein